MAKTSQILLLLLVAVAVQSYGGRRSFRGRSHGRFRNPYDYYHHRRYSGERPHAHPNKHHQINPRNPGDLSDSSHIARHSAVPDSYNVGDLESTTVADPPMSDPSPVDNLNPDGDNSVPDLGMDLTGSENNDKPNDVATVIDNGESPDSVNSDKPGDDTNVNENGTTPGVEEPDNIGDNINVGEQSSEENPDNTIDVNGMSLGGDEDKPNPGDSDNSSDSNLNGKLDGNQPNMIDNPQDSIEVNGLELGNDEGSSSNESPNGENGYLNNDKRFPEDKNKPGHDSNNIDNGELQPNENNGDINVNGLSPGEDNNEPKYGDEDNSGHGSIDVNGLSPGGDNSENDDNNININGLSPGGDDADDPGINVHGGLSNNVLGKPNQNNVIAHGLEPDNHNHQNHAINNTNISDNNDGFPAGHGSIGAHIDLPNVSGHIDLGGLLPKPSEHTIDHGGLDSHFIQPVPDPDMVHPHPSEGNGDHLDINQPQMHPTSPDDDILPNPGDNMPHIPMPGVHGRPDEIPSIEIPDLEDNNEGKKNNSMMIPVLLPGGGHIMVQAGALGNIPSYIIVKINGQPTLIQNPAGVGVSGGNTGSLDLSNLILGNNVASVGGINGALLPSWLNLGGLGGNGGVSIGGGGNIGILPNTQPIWISSQLPNYGGGGGAGGSFIIPNNEPVQPVPVPIPIPRPMPPPRPIYPTPQPIPLPEPIDPGFNINTYPGIPWPSNWNPNNPKVNVNFTHVPLTPNQGSNIDWKKLYDLLANIDSRLPKPQPSRPKEPTPQPTYPMYPQYPYIYPPPFTYPLYPYLPDYLYPKPTGPGKNVPNSEENLAEEDTSNPHPREPRPWPEEPLPVPLPMEPRPVPLPEGSRPTPLPEGSRPVPLPEEPRPEPQPEEHYTVPLPEEPRPEPQPKEPRPEPQPEEPSPVPLPEEPRLEPLPEESNPTPLPEELYPIPLPEEPHPELQPEEPRPETQPEELRPEPQPEEPSPVPLPEEPHLAPLPEELNPTPLPEESHPVLLPEEPHPVPFPEEPHPLPLPEESRPVPLPEEPHPAPLPEQAQPVPLPEEPWPVPLPEEPHPTPLPEEPCPKPLPEEPQPAPLADEPRPVLLPEEPHLAPLPEEPHNVPLPEDPRPVAGQDIHIEPHKDTPLTPKPHPEHPDHHHHDNPVINLPDIHITLPKPTHGGKPKPGHPGLDSGLIDILNVLLKFPDRNSHHPPKNIESLIKFLLTILKPGDKQPDLDNLSHLLLHLLDGRKEPNLNVLVEPGMDEGAQANPILLLELLANNLGGNSYPMGYYQPENPLLYFLGHFPCDHPNIPAISGMQSSSSNLWQLLANMYGHKYDQEFRLERSAEETDADDKSAGEVQKPETN